MPARRTQFVRRRTAEAPFTSCGEQNGFAGLRCWSRCFAAAHTVASATHQVRPCLPLPYVLFLVSHAVVLRSALDKSNVDVVVHSMRLLLELRAKATDDAVIQSASAPKFRV